MKDSKYKGQLNRCEVESVIAPLRDKEPTPAWRKQFKSTLKHYEISFGTLSELTANSNKVNLLGRRYGKTALQSLLGHYNDGHNDWTKNGFRTINDHLDVLVDYLSKPTDLFEAAAETLNDTIVKTSEFISKTQTTPLKDSLEPTTMTLRERLEKERAEGKWPSVDKRMKEWANNMSKLFTDEDEDIDAPEPIKAVDETSEANKVRVKRIRKNKKHKKHKSNNIYITINIGR